MTELIPALIIESIDTAKPVRLTPAQAGGPIHTRSFGGRYRNLRLLGAGLLFALFFGTAWINWNGRQAVFWDLGRSQFHIFGATYWPQDFILLSAILIIAAFGLFFITALAGRVWCGYACPQSIWTWVFMRIEQITEGDRGRRIKLDNAPWTLKKIMRRGAKHGLWLAASLVTALAFVGYFTPIRELTSDLITLQVSATKAFWLMFFTAATYINAGWLREKVCRDMCPYSRFQSVMFDRDTLIISYDAARGEGRGPRKIGVGHKAEGLGDCVDCTMCVQVCPTGIDIRDGLQLDCIGCGACIDACDSVMDKVGYARGLVRYSSESEMAGGYTRWMRPNLIGYAVMLLLMIGTFVWALAERPQLSLDVTRDRGLYRENEAGQIENIYSLKIINKTQQERRYSISLTELGEFELHGARSVQLKSGEIRVLPVSVAQTSERSSPSRQFLNFEVADQSEPSSRANIKSTFLTPLR